MNNKCRWQESAQLRICLLFLTLALSVTISVARDDKAGPVQASGASGQQLLQQGKPLDRAIAEGEMHSS